jgi:hypothetical protein
MKICAVGAELFHAVGQTDKHVYRPESGKEGRRVGGQAGMPAGGQAGRWAGVQADMRAFRN